MTFARIFHSELEQFLLKNTPLDNFLNLPLFDYSRIFWLEKLGEGGFGVVQKAYHKDQKRFIAIKRYLKSNRSYLKQILLEDYLLQRVEKVRTANNGEFSQCFLQYFGAFTDPKNKDSVILVMENGVATLKNLLDSGKVYKCEELAYVLHILAQGFSILEKNGVANRDVKPDNVILVEDSNDENRILYKISDFGIGCILENGETLLPGERVSGFTKRYAAPEIIGLGSKEMYNPFIADVYSLGLLCLQMINKKWDKKALRNGLLSNKKCFNGYQALLEVLKGMLDENPDQRWSFSRILEFYIEKVDNNDPNFHIANPCDEKVFCQKWQVEIKEKKLEDSLEDLERLYDEHMNLYQAYTFDVTRTAEEKFHLDQSWELVRKMERKFELHQSVEDILVWDEKKWTLKMNNIAILKSYGEYFTKIGENEFARKRFSDCLEEIEKIKAENGMNNEIRKNDLMLCECGILNSSGLFYQEMGEFLQAEKCFLRTLSIYESFSEENPTHRANLMNNLGNLYTLMGNLTKAEDFLLKSLKMQEDNFGSDHEFVGKSFGNLANLYREMRNFPKAEEFYLKALKIFEEVFGENHVLVATLMNNMGNLHRSLGNLQKAEGCYLKTLIAFRNLLGESNPNVASSYSNLGSIYREMGDLTKAEEYSKLALELFLKLFGEKHWDVADSYEDLGKIWADLEDLPKTEEYYLKALKIRKEIFGEKHVYVGRSFFRLGKLYNKIGNLLKAEEHLQKALEIRLDLFGESHSEVANAFGELGSFYSEKGEFDKAEDFYLKALKIQESLFGENEDVAITMSNMGRFYFDKGDVQKAEKFSVKALQILEGVAGENKEDMAIVLNNLSHIYKSMGNLAEAEEFYLKSLKIQQTLDGGKTNIINCEKIMKNV